MPQSTRFWEIDLFRGVAVLMMITYHLLFNLVFFGGCRYNLTAGFWFYFQQATASFFIFLAGSALTLSHARAPHRSYLRFFQRGLKILSWGLAVTAVTWLFLRKGFVVFGILHLIGLSIILAIPFVRRSFWALPAGVFCIITGNYLNNLEFNFPWLLWLGFVPQGFFTVDYFPLLPWFGGFLLGVFCGNLFYPGGRRLFSLPDLSGFPPVRGIVFLGRHSLLIYLLHQPVLLGLLTVLGLIEFF